MTKLSIVAAVVRAPRLGGTCQGPSFRVNSPQVAKMSNIACYAGRPAARRRFESTLSPNGTLRCRTGLEH
jgi:hypothetical protein